MTTETSLIALEDICVDKAPAIYGHNKLHAYVEAARAAVASEVPDLTTRKGRERIASLAAQVSRSKTAVEKPGREYLKRIKELPRTIEAELREFVTAMDALRDQVRRPLTEWEEAEKARIEAHRQSIEWLRGLAAQVSGFPSEKIEALIADAESVELGPQWEEFEAEVARTKDAVLLSLREALAKRRQYEAEQAELERLRREAAEREQKEREERIAREAAERAQREAEQRAQAEREAAIRREQEAKAEAERRELQLKLQAEQAEREKLEAQQRAEQAARDAEARAKAAAEAERQRIADEQARAEAEAKARAADQAHRTAILTAAKEAVMQAGVTEDQARAVINLIRRGMVPNVHITF